MNKDISTNSLSSKTRFLVNSSVPSSSSSTPISPSVYGSSSTTTLPVPSSSSIKRVKNLDERFSLIFQALLTYKQHRGDLLIPRKYKIPLQDTAYPALLRGKCLGYMTYQLRHAPEYRKFQSQLLEIGFVYDVNYYEFVYRIVTACQQYESFYGRGSIYQMSSKYFIEEEDLSYPVQCRGLKLGSIVSAIKQGKSYIAYYDQFMSIFPPPTRKLPYRLQFHHRLNKLPPKRSEEEAFEDEMEELAEAYEWENTPETSKQETESALITSKAMSRDEKFALLKQSIQVYASIHGHLWVPTAYTIPEDDERYPGYMRGKGLGMILANIRAKQLYQAPQYQQELKQIGVMITNVYHQRASLVLKAVKEYRDCYGHVNIPTTYIIPMTTNFASTTPSERFQKLKIPKKKGKRQRKQKKVTEQEEVNEKYFVIEPPSSTVSFHGFSKELHGMKLGAIVNQIKNGNTYKRYAYRFRQLGIPIIRDSK